MDPKIPRLFPLDPGRIFLNIRGRQADGCVEPGDAAKLRDEIAAGLAEMRIRVPWSAEPTNRNCSYALRIAYDSV